MNKFCLLFLVCLMIGCSKPENTESPSTPSNVVIIFLDDSGFADFGPYNGGALETPGVDKLAAEGCVYDKFYVPQAICSASRSALMTGSYPGRTKVFGAHAPRDKGLDPSFPTMGEIFKAAGYKTAMFGKWHLGDQDATHPHNRGFDETAGLMYSNDMWKFHPQAPEYWGKYPIQYWENGAVTIEDVLHEEQSQLTKWYTEKSVDFINRHKEEPFLLYVPHSMPHVPLYVSKDFEGKSGQGLYGDVILELDWSVDQINQALKDNGLEDNTIVIFTSDNGPWLAYGNHAGKTPFREGKATSFEGGLRTACIIKYPPAIEAGSKSSSTFFSIDLLPSLCHLTGVPLPEREIDGENLWPLISGQAAGKNTHEYYAFSNAKNFEGVFSPDGKWKLHLPHGYRSLVEEGGDALPGKYENVQIDTALYNLEADPYEKNNLLKSEPELAKQLLDFAAKHKARFYSE